MAQYRKAIIVIDNCKDCPCNKVGFCSHKVVSKIYGRILEYYPDSIHMTDVGPDYPITFSDKDKKQIEKSGFPRWCPLDRSK